MDEAFLPDPAPVDINLDEPMSPGPDWIYQGDLGDQWAYINRRSGNRLLVPKNGYDPPSQWGLVS